LALYGRKLNEAETFIAVKKLKGEKMKVLQAERRKAMLRQEAMEMEQRAAEEQRRASAINIVGVRDRLATFGTTARYTKPAASPAPPPATPPPAASTATPLRRGFNTAAPAASSAAGPPPGPSAAVASQAVPTAARGDAGVVEETTPSLRDRLATFGGEKVRRSSKAGFGGGAAPAMPAGPPISIVTATVTMPPPRPQSQKAPPTTAAHTAVSSLAAPDTPSGAKISPRLPRASQAQQLIAESKCVACTKPVYNMERLVVDGLLLHKWCFRCAECNKRCTPGGYASLDGFVYCKPHFKQLFQLKGNYNEGFGTTQRKHDFSSDGVGATTIPNAALIGNS